MHNYKIHQLQPVHDYQVGKHLVVKIGLKYSDKIIIPLVYVRK